MQSWWALARDCKGQSTPDRARHFCLLIEQPMQEVNKAFINVKAAQFVADECVKISFGKGGLGDLSRFCWNLLRAASLNAPGSSSGSRTSGRVPHLHPNSPTFQHLKYLLSAPSTPKIPHIKLTATLVRPMFFASLHDIAHIYFRKTEICIAFLLLILLRKRKISI